DRIAARAPASVVDAYAGQGDLALSLEGTAAAITLIELDAEAVARARARVSSGTRVIEGRVAYALAGALPSDLIVFNPPRTGLHERIPTLLEQLAGASPSRPATRPALIYVSCNPATLARDIARLPSYRI